MNIYLLIARRFLFPRNGFRSNTINFISFVGLFLFDHQLDVPAILGISLIISGVLVIHLFSKTVQH